MNLTWQKGRDEMDKQTAIDLLDNLLGMVEDNHESDYDTAIKMCIDALKMQMSGNMGGTQKPLDCISRQAVINEMKDMYTAAEEWAEGAHEDDTKARAESCMATNVELKLRIEKLPSVQPQRMKGTWIHKWSGDGSVWMEQRCSECGCVKEDEPVDYNYCPNCGADMRGGQDGTT